MSNRADRFKRVAPRRVNRVREELRKLGSCGQKTTAYEYTDNQRDKIFHAIDQAVLEMKAQFRVSEEFSLHEHITTASNCWCNPEVINFG